MRHAALAPAATCGVSDLRDAQKRIREINERNPVTDKNALATKVSELLAAINADNAERLTEIRKALNESGISAARARLTEYLNDLPAAQDAVRAAQEGVRLARLALDQATAEAEWELDSRFISEGNKTFLLINEARDDEERRQMTADERKEWKKNESRHTPGVQQAMNVFDAAESDLGAARDLLAWHDKAFSAAKADLNASVAIVQTIAITLQGDNQP